MNSKINTDNVFRDKELDQGFILRANEEVAKVLKTIIHGEAKSDKSMSISLLDPSKRCYGLNIDGKLYLASLVDLPCIIEAQKTLDYKTFYKSTDAAQMLYIHNQCLEDIASRSQEDVSIFVNSFNPLTDDEQFLQNLYQRRKLKDRLKRHKETGEPLKLDDLKWRHGLSPAAQNIRNVRHKVDPIVDRQKVQQVESVLKSIIETGFADNCKEELLVFDKNGKLEARKPGVISRNRDEASILSEHYSYSVPQSGNPSLYNDDQSAYQEQLSVAPSSIQMQPTTQIDIQMIENQPVEEELEVPQNFEEYCYFRMEYKAIKNNIKQAATQQLSEPELLELKVKKRIYKRMKKQVEQQHPEWRKQK